MAGEVAFSAAGQRRWSVLWGHRGGRSDHRSNWWARSSTIRSGATGSRSAMDAPSVWSNRANPASLPAPATRCDPGGRVVAKGALGAQGQRLRRPPARSALVERALSPRGRFASSPKAVPSSSRAVGSLAAHPRTERLFLRQRVRKAGANAVGAGAVARGLADPPGVAEGFADKIVVSLVHDPQDENRPGLGCSSEEPDIVLDWVCQRPSWNSWLARCGDPDRWPRGELARSQLLSWGLTPSQAQKAIEAYGPAPG